MIKVAQYIARTEEERDSIVVIAELLGCDYRISEMILAVMITDTEQFDIISRCDPAPKILVSLDHDVVATVR